MKQVLKFDLRYLNPLCAKVKGEMIWSLLETDEFNKKALDIANFILYPDK